MWTISCTLILCPNIKATQLHSHSTLRLQCQDIHLHPLLAALTLRSQGLKSGGPNFPHGPGECSGTSTRGCIINRPEKANKLVKKQRK